MGIEKMVASYYFADIIGINLAYALEAYEWGSWRPLTDDGFTVAGFWRGDAGQELPTGYELDDGERYFSRKR